MAQQAILAVTVDALGTLVWMEPPAPHLREQLRRAAGVEVSEEQAAKAFGDEIAYYLRHHLEGRDPESLSELRDRCAGVVRTSLGLEHVDLARISEALLSSIHFHAFDDARPALEELRARGLRLVAASNWDASLPEVLERTGLAPLLDGVVSSAMVGATKPAPEVFRAALELAGAPAERALHVGDSLANDIAGARGLGMRAVLVAREGAGPGADGVPVIAALTELPGLLSGQ
ncbi:MAG TPA: HAD-IA family hydrolase [Thermoleophilaceae bacterium]|jgi:putative hydrolase of the HAD superfamily|nr:HAD-IA family hydrolase [Thermoleophilaceae bacterium]